MNQPDDRPRTPSKMDVSGSAQTVTSIGHVAQMHIHNDPGATKPTPDPHEVPPPSPHSHNRAEELAILDEILETDEQRYGPRQVLVDGDPGVGKTNLVSQWAWPLEKRFRNGRIYCNLYDYAVDRVVDLCEVLGKLLRSLGVPEESMQSTVDGRSGQWRSATHGLSLLVILDNIEEPAYLAHLLPASDASTVVLVSRVNAAAFLATGASRVAVRPFSGDHSRALLSKICGPHRLKSEPDAARDLLDMCGGRPGTVALIGSCIAVSENLTLTEVLCRITEETNTVNHSTVELVAKRLALASLDEPETKLYRRLQCLPGTDFSAELATALTDAASAAPLLRNLESAGLLGPEESRRWRTPDSTYDAPGNTTIVRQILDWYVAAARAADESVMGRQRLRAISAERIPSVTSVPEFGSGADALRWLGTEVRNLVAVQQYAADADWNEAVVALEDSLWTLYLNAKFPGYWEAGSRRAIAAAQRWGDRAAESRMRAQRGRYHQEQGELAEAVVSLLEARHIAAELPGERLEASAAEMLGRVYLEQDEFTAARTEFEFTLKANQRLGLPRAVALARHNLGQLDAAVGESDRALRHFQLARDGFAADDPRNEGRVLLDMSALRLRCGDPEAGLVSVEAARKHLDGQGMQLHVAKALGIRGDLWLACGGHDMAAESWRRALDIHISQHNADSPAADRLRSALEGSHDAPAG